MLEVQDLRTKLLELKESFNKYKQSQSGIVLGLNEELLSTLLTDLNTIALRISEIREYKVMYGDKELTWQYLDTLVFDKMIHDSDKERVIKFLMNVIQSKDRKELVTETNLQAITNVCERFTIKLREFNKN